jgi:thiamine-monophosphate kinase
VDEFELIRRYFVRDSDARDVCVGIGDDGAVLRPDPDRDLVTVVDTLVENVHFAADMSPFDIGYRAVAVNLSDIAAMGARPRWMTLALTLREARADWLEDFAAGLDSAAAAHGVTLVGGDTTRGECIVVSVQITGDVAAGSAILRSGARVGDTIFVTGTVGDSAAGRELLAAGREQEFLTRRFRHPIARVEFGGKLGGAATAAIDVSDGLYTDLEKLLSASGVGGVIDLECLPISAALRSTFDREAQRRLALSGGDDYELCFTADAANLPDSGELMVTAIGKVRPGAGLECREAGKTVDYTDSGYRHFK